MIVLDSTSGIVRLVTTVAVALDVQASYVDSTDTTYTPGSTPTAISTATTTTIVAAPAASTQRGVKAISICARGGANTVTVEYFDGSTAFRVLSVSLAANERLEYEDAHGWQVIDATGHIKTTGVGSGRLLRAAQILTAGTSINHPTGTATIRVYGAAGGGAGGGVNNSPGAMGGCGGSGTYGEKWFTAGASSSTYVVGAAGAGVSGATGGNGTNSTFTHNGLTVTLPFGSGGVFVAGAASIATAAGGAGGGAATNADVSVQGQNGGMAFRPTAVAGFAAHTGPGGSTPLGVGGMGQAAVAAQVAGLPGKGFGAGGSGALEGTSTTAAIAGAAGTQGIWFVEEYS